MLSIAYGLSLVLLIATVSVALGALGRIALGVLLPGPGPGPDDDPRWVRRSARRRPEGAEGDQGLDRDGGSPCPRDPRTPTEAFEQGSARIARTLAPDAIVPIARLAPVPRNGSSASDGPASAGSSTTAGHEEQAPDVAPAETLGRGIDLISVRF